MSIAFKPGDMFKRIGCFGEFDRSDNLCLKHCGLNFECAAMREHMYSLDFTEDELPVLNTSRRV